MQFTKKCFNTFFLAIDMFNKGALLLSIFGFVGLCFAQVVCRYIFNSSLVWSEQACRYLFCVTTFLGAALCVNEGSHTTIDILAEFLGTRAKKYQAIVIHILIFFFAIVLTTSGWTLMSKNLNQMTTTLPLKMGTIYMMIPISAALMVINAARVLGRNIHSLLTNADTNEGRESN